MPADRISVVVPTFNEEEHLGRCLSALEQQLDDIAEVIVVDNNSTDGSVAIANSFAARLPQFRVIKVAKPGVIAARNAGFNVASGEIIARVDADTVAAPGWAASIAAFFASAPGEFGAAMGVFDQYDLPFQKANRKMVESLIHSAATEPEGGYRRMQHLFGNNMAVRAQVWRQIQPMLTDRADITEDRDFSICVLKSGHHIGFVPGMHVSASGRRMLSSVPSYWRYTARNPRTYAMHGLRKEAAMQWLPVTFNRVLHLVMLVPLRAYDPQTEKFSVARVLKRTTSRPIPTGE
jgi:glycosyltransferase involved in cell wall biosynthesis